MGMALDEPEQGEETVEINGIDVLIADMVKPFTEGNTLDYVKYPDGEGFVLEGGSSC